MWCILGIVLLIIQKVSRLLCHSKVNIESSWIFFFRYFLGKWKKPKIVIPVQKQLHATLILTPSTRIESNTKEYYINWMRSVKLSLKKWPICLQLPCRAGYLFHLFQKQFSFFKNTFKIYIKYRLKNNAKCQLEQCSNISKRLCISNEFTLVPCRTNCK